MLLGAGAVDVVKVDACLTADLGERHRRVLSHHTAADEDRNRDRDRADSADQARHRAPRAGRPCMAFSYVSLARVASSMRPTFAYSAASSR